MKNKIKRIVYALIAVVIWISVWEIIARTINLSFVIPTFPDTIRTFFDLLLTADFWQTICTSLLRILLGFVIGAALGIAIAPLTHRSELVYAIISPIMTVIKSTPVASFILVLWCLIGKHSVPTAIGILMVMPIVWQNLSDGFKSIDTRLGEVCTIYEVSPLKKFKILIAPTLMKFLIPALITSSALAWKSGIAAEIIVYAKDSIGKEIIDAKNFFESEKMFAWTMAVVLLSICIEFVIKKLTKAVKKL